MLKVSSNKIMINRGDIGVLSITAKNEDGSDYTFKVGDIVRFRIMKNNDCNMVLKQKDVEVTVETTVVDINLLSEDTTIGDIINSPVNYWYEVELNPETAPQTIIGFDDKGAKILVLYPESGDFNSETEMVNDDIS